MIRLSANPLKARINAVLVEEKRLSRSILRQEEIIRRWLQDAPVLAEKSETSLDTRSVLRKDSAALRLKGAEALRNGMSLLEEERKKVRGHHNLKSNKKNAPPRLIDIEL